MRRVAILMSGRGSNMAALIDAAREPGYPAEIAVVISNKTNAAGLADARASGVPVEIIESKPFGANRGAFEEKLQSVLDQNRIDLICLAGFMRLFTPEFVNAWQGRMLNIHPSLLPAFKGLDPHGQALRAGVRLSGATVHFVTPEMDAGPIVMQGAIAIQADDIPETLAARVLHIEHQIYPAALKLVAGEHVRIDGDRCIIDGTKVTDATLVAPAL